MAGVTDLQLMLSSMRPELLHEDYVFLTFSDAVYGDYAGLDPVAAVREKEGLTLVVAKQSAVDQGHAFDGVLRCISLNVHSALEAPGLVAAFSSALAAEGISSNVLAGYYHDHIFVPELTAERALFVLQRLAASANDSTGD